MAQTHTPRYHRGHLCPDVDQIVEKLERRNADLIEALEALATVVGEGMIDGEYVLRPQLTTAHAAAIAAITKARSDA